MIFIITYGRSGSTALQNALNASPRYCIRGENGGALNHLVKAWSIVGVNSANMKSVQPTHPWYGIHLADADEFGRHLADAFVQSVLKPVEGSIMGFKDIRYTTEHLNDDEFLAVLDFMRRYMNGRFIFLTRDPEKVARSGWWAKRPASEVEDLIERTNSRFRDNAKSGAFLIDHSEFDRNPKGLLPLFDWLEQPAPPSLAQVMRPRLRHLGNPIRNWLANRR